MPDEGFLSRFLRSLWPLLFLALLLLFAIAAVERVDEVGEDLAGVIRRITLPTPASPATERTYIRVDLLPPKESLPRSRGLAWGTCYHLNYEDWGWMSPDLLRVLLLTAAQNSRCALLYMGPSTAANTGFVRMFLETARGVGISRIVLRIDIRPIWDRAAAVNRDADITTIIQAYGNWIGSWGAGMTEYGESFGMELARGGVYVQLLNEPNVDSEWQNPPPELFSRTDPSGARLYTGDLRSLGSMVCRFYAGYVRALFPPMVGRNIFGEVYYRTDIPQPLLVIPDLAAAGAEEKRAYLEGCLDEIARIPGMDPEYVVHALRGGIFAYGFHIYLPCTTDPFAISQEIRETHLDAVVSSLRSLSTSGLPFITDVLITEFGGAFAPGSGCNRNTQKDLYEAFTALYPDIPAFWWVFAAPSCGYGDYASNMPQEWNKSAWVEYRREGNTVTVVACEHPGGER